MAQNCNKIAQLSEEQFDAKAAVAKVATISILKATSNCYKATEIMHTGQAIERATVYLRAAMANLDAADAALARNKDILASVPVDPAALRWLHDLDYERLYAEGVRDGIIMSNRKQWDELVELNQTDGYMAVTDGIRIRLVDMKNSIQELVGHLPKFSEDGSNAVPLLTLKFMTQLGDVVAFSQMVAHVNRVEPMDPRWLASHLAPATSTTS